VLTAVAFSGGDDSTAMAYLMAERGEDFVLLFTPAGDEFPELFDHVRQTADHLGRELIQPPNETLAFWIDHHNALPNWRMRWCTRAIKIEPCIAWLLRHPGTTLCVGLRADEEDRQGLYGDYCTYRYPLREEGWTDADVHAYLATKGVRVPPRTNCALCYGQRLSEWWTLWRERPEKWAEGEVYEAKTGHTFRSPGRDTWPAPLVELRARFERGDIPRGVEVNHSLFDDAPKVCRVCTL
jgi:3'-phosphoadenosine 5'-phosphosulfate sulfotransferase (PAPS reductase)/FAD synthetase